MVRKRKIRYSSQEKQAKKALTWQNLKTLNEISDKIKNVMTDEEKDITFDYVCESIIVVNNFKQVTEKINEINMCRKVSQHLEYMRSLMLYTTQLTENSTENTIVPCNSEDLVKNFESFSLKPQRTSNNDLRITSNIQNTKLNSVSEESEIIEINSSQETYCSTAEIQLNSENTNSETNSNEPNQTDKNYEKLRQTINIPESNEILDSLLDFSENVIQNKDTNQKCELNSENKLENYTHTSEIISKGNKQLNSDEISKQISNTCTESINKSNKKVILVKKSSNSNQYLLCKYENIKIITNNEQFKEASSLSNSGVDKIKHKLNDLTNDPLVSNTVENKSQNKVIVPTENPKSSFDKQISSKTKNNDTLNNNDNITEKNNVKLNQIIDKEINILNSCLDSNKLDDININTECNSLQICNTTKNDFEKTSSENVSNVNVTKNKKVIVFEKPVTKTNTGAIKKSSSTKNISSNISENIKHNLDSKITNRESKNVKYIKYNSSKWNKNGKNICSEEFNFSPDESSSYSEQFLYNLTHKKEDNVSIDRNNDLSDTITESENVNTNKIMDENMDTNEFSVTKHQLEFEKNKTSCNTAITSHISLQEPETVNNVNENNSNEDNSVDIPFQNSQSNNSNSDEPLFDEAAAFELPNSNSKFSLFESTQEKKQNKSSKFRYNDNLSLSDNIENCMSVISNDIQLANTRKKKKNKHEFKSLFHTNIDDTLTQLKNKKNGESSTKNDYGIQEFLDQNNFTEVEEEGVDIEEMKKLCSMSVQDIILNFRF